jgi:hypothetical protein
MRDAGELTIRQNRNIGTADVTGHDVDLLFRPTAWLSVFGNDSKSQASTTDVLAPTLVQCVPPSPVEKRTDGEVLTFARATPGAVGYVSETVATDGVRVIAVN